MKQKNRFILTAILMATLMLLVSCGGKPTLPSAKENPATIFFATDLHYISQSLTDNGPGFVERMEYGDGKVAQYCEAYTEAFALEAIAAQPDAVVLGGDLTLNGSKQSHLDLAEKLRRLQKSGVPVLLIPGNHDLDGYRASKYIGYEAEHVDSVDEKGFYKIYKEFGYSDAVSRDKSSLSYFYPLRSDLWVLMLDVNAGQEYNVVSDDTLAWLEAELQKAKAEGVTVLSATHQNLLGHNPLFASGQLVNNSDSVVELFDRYGVVCNLSGHIHIQHVAQREAGVSEIVTTAMTATPHQYGVITFDGGKTDYQTKATDVAGWAAKAGQTDPNLLSFAEFSERFFYQVGYRQTMDVQLEEGVPEADCKEMADYFGEVNTKYFQGKKIDRGQNDPGYLLWQRYAAGERRIEYIDSMLQRANEDHTRATFAGY